MVRVSSSDCEWLACRRLEQTSLGSPFTDVARQDFWDHPAVRRHNLRRVNNSTRAARCVNTSCDHARVRSQLQAALTLTQLAPLTVACLAANICGARGPITGRYRGSRAEPAPCPGPQPAAQRIERDRGRQCGRGVRDRGREAEYLGCQQEQCRADSADQNRTGRVVQSPSKHFALLCAPIAFLPNSRLGSERYGIVTRMNAAHIPGRVPVTFPMPSVSRHDRKGMAQRHRSQAANKWSGQPEGCGRPRRS